MNNFQDIPYDTMTPEQKLEWLVQTCHHDEVESIFNSPADYIHEHRFVQIAFGVDEGPLVNGMSVTDYLASKSDISDIKELFAQVTLLRRVEDVLTNRFATHDAIQSLCQAFRAWLLMQ